MLTFTRDRFGQCVDKVVRTVSSNFTLPRASKLVRFGIVAKAEQRSLLRISRWLIERTRKPGATPPRLSIW